MSHRWPVLLFAGKTAVAALLIAWLLRSGALDLGALRLLVDKPGLLAASLALFIVGAGFGALRWRLLLQLADVRLPLSRALQLQLTAVFFNVVVPGGIGGDVIKSIYVARQLAPARRPVVFLIALVDRLTAVAGLVMVAVAATVLGGPTVWQHPQLRALIGVLAALALAAAAAVAVAIVLVRRSRPRVQGPPGGATRFARTLAQLAEAARLVADRPRALVIALGLAVAVYVAGIATFAACATAITHHDAPIPVIASIYPLGMLTLVIPISPAGIGVGHVAFDHLFSIAGLDSGATVFNVYLVGQIAPCLLGAVPYLALRRTAAPPTEAEVQAANRAGPTGTDYDVGR